MIDWSFPPDIQEKYDRVLKQIRYLQKELGVEPRTLEQRYQDYLARLEQEQKRKQEFERLQLNIGSRRPPPKWKV